MKNYFLGDQRDSPPACLIYKLAGREPSTSRATTSNSTRLSNPAWRSCVNLRDLSIGLLTLVPLFAPSRKLSGSGFRVMRGLKQTHIQSSLSPSGFSNGSIRTICVFLCRYSYIYIEYFSFKKLCKVF